MQEDPVETGGLGVQEQQLGDIRRPGLLVLLPRDIGEAGTWVQLELSNSSLNFFLGSGVLATKGKDQENSFDNTVVEIQGMDPHPMPSTSQAALG